ncbi:MAG: sulfatase-like hydrolase/transferase [Planctomycetota bacterium]|jgi:arylsulfatase A-like enzyme
MSIDSAKPNIVIIIPHDVGRHVNCYYDKIQTPNIKRIFKNGVCFDNFFSVSPQCSPARGALITGRYPHTNGFMGLKNAGFELPEEEVTMRAVRTEKYKYIRNYPRERFFNIPIKEYQGADAVIEGKINCEIPDFPEEELYSISEDKGERNNLAADPPHKEELEKLRQILDNWMKETNDPLLNGPIPMPLDTLLMHKGILTNIYGIAKQELAPRDCYFAGKYMI